MTLGTPLRALLGTTALALPMMLVMPAAAQQNNQQTQQQAASGQQSEQAANACQDLRALLDEEGGDVTLDLSRLEAMIDQGEAERCLVVLEEVEAVGGFAQVEEQDEYERIIERAEEIEEVATRDVSATASVSETVELEREAVVSGEIVVGIPRPGVSVRQRSPEVDVQSSQPEVNVRQAAPEVLVRQPRQQIAMEMPQPTITITQEAPEIIVTMPDPEVDVQSAEPQVRVSMEEPEVSVSMAEPEIAFDLDAELVEPGEAQALRDRVESGDAENPVRSRVEQASDDEGPDVQFESANAVVNSSMSEGEPRINIERAEPTVRWEATEPEITFSMAEEPEVRIEQTGEPRVRFEQASAGEQDSEEQQASAQQEERTEGMPLASDDEAETEVEQAGESVEQGTETAAEETGEAAEDTAEAAGGAASGAMAEFNEALDRDEDMTASATEVNTFVVSDLEGRSVRNMQGEDLGDVERVVMNNGTGYLVISHGGFLGIGDEEYALPMERVYISGDEIVLEGLSEEELEALPEYDENAEQALGAEDQIEMRYEG